MNVSGRNVTAEESSSLYVHNHFVYPRSNYNIKRCYHTLRICLIKQGIGEWVVEDKIYDVKKDDIFIFNNIETRALRTVQPPEPLIILIIEFEPRFIWAFGENKFDFVYLKSFFARSKNFENRLDRDNAATARIRSLMLEIEEEDLSRLNEYEQMIKVNLLSILININRHYGYTERDLSIGPKESIMYINRVMDHIENHIAEELQLNSLAKIARMNPSYFSTLFKKYNGITLSQYIMRKRIHKAVDYLQSSNHSVIEIASLCGFNTAANFYKAFKAVTGKVPSDYRRGE